VSQVSGAVKPVEASYQPYLASIAQSAAVVWHNRLRGRIDHDLVQMSNWVKEARREFQGSQLMKSRDHSDASSAHRRRHPGADRLHPMRNCCKTSTTEVTGATSKNWRDLHTTPERSLPITDARRRQGQMTRV